jgi:hypothetical protein
MLSLPKRSRLASTRHQASREQSASVQDDVSLNGLAMGSAAIFRKDLPVAALTVGKTDEEISLLFEDFFYVANLILHFAFHLFRGTSVA